MSMEMISKGDEIIKLRYTDEDYGGVTIPLFWHHGVMVSDIRFLIESALHDVYAQVEIEESKKKGLSSLLSKVKQAIIRKRKQMKAEPLPLYDFLAVASEVFFEKKLQYYTVTLKTKKEIRGEPREWPAYTSEDFEKIIENVRGLVNVSDDKSQILYHMMEIETLLGRTEEKARAVNRKYEARLAASLRDICRVQEPGTISEEQMKRFAACTRALIEGWGKLNREKVRWIRNRLLEVGLTWLPITDKAIKDISKAKTLTQ